MKGTIEELWHGNIIPQEDSRRNSKETKELLSYMARITRTWRKASLTSRKKSSKSSMIAGANMRVLQKKRSSCMPSSSVGG